MKKRVLKVATVLTVCVFMFSVTACSGNKTNEEKTEQKADTTVQATTTETTEEKTVELTDAQIASAAVVANQIDVDYANIAQDISTNEEVLKFAEAMAKDHTNVIKQAAALAKKLGVTPDGNNPVTESLLAGAEKIKAKLKGLKGQEFAKAYINNEVAYHEAVINALKTTLIPQTDNQELKDLLKGVMPALEMHLHMAKEAQSKIVK